MTAIITPEGRSWLATQQANPTGKTIATVKFLDSLAVVVHTASVSTAGKVEPDMVSYGVILASAVGTFTFEKLEFYSDDAVPVRVLEDTVQLFTKTAGGLSWSHATLLKYSDVASITGITVPAETWQLNFEGHFDNIEADARSGLARLLGRFAALNDAFKVSAPLPTIVDALDVVGSWVLSGGSGAITVDAADKLEGAASLEVAGQVVNAELSLDFGAPVDWSANNGVVARAKSAAAATNILFFIEDNLGNRNEWNIVAQTAFSEHEIDLTAPDVNGAADYANVKKMGWGGLDAAETYNFDAIERLRFNDFSLAAGDAFLEGAFLQPVATQYSDHLKDWNNDLVTVPAALAPPGAGTRNDGVWLDLHLLPGADGPTPVMALTVATAPQVDFVDGNGFQHHLEKLADILRDTGERITTAMITDTRRVLPHTSPLGLIAKHVADEIAALVDVAPLALDTLNELAAALGDDANFAATMTTALAAKQETSEKGAANGYAALDAGTLVPVAQVPFAAPGPIGSTTPNTGKFANAEMTGPAPAPPLANTHYKDNVAAAWIRFDGTGVIAIGDSFNVASITDNGTGDYTITWDLDFANANYAFVSTVNGGWVRIVSLLVGAARIETLSAADAFTDHSIICASAFGDQ